MLLKCVGYITSEAKLEQMSQFGVVLALLTADLEPSSKEIYSP